MQNHTNSSAALRLTSQLSASAALLMTTIACQPAPTVGPTEVIVRGADYAFEVPDTLQPGQTALRFQNAGKVDHEFFVVLLKAGVSLPQFQDRVKAGENHTSLSDGVVGALMVAPGATGAGALLVELLPGRTYAMFCNLQDGPDKPLHSALGMVASRTVAARR